MSRQVDIALAGAAFARAAGGSREVFGDFFLLRLLGFEVTHDATGCEVAFDAVDFLFSPQGTLHGGVLATALDIAMGHLIERQAGPGTTLELKVQFLAPVRGGRVICRGEAMRRGGIWFLRAEARDSSGAMVAFATSTWKRLTMTAGKAATTEETSR